MRTTTTSAPTGVSRRGFHPANGGGLKTFNNNGRLFCSVREGGVRFVDLPLSRFQKSRFHWQSPSIDRRCFRSGGQFR